VHDLASGTVDFTKRLKQFGALGMCPGERIGAPVRQQFPQANDIGHGFVSEKNFNGDSRLNKLEHLI
jgi:hypothetical protein